MKRLTTILISAGVLLVAAAVFMQPWQAARSPQPDPGYRRAVIAPLPKLVGPLELTDQFGRPFTNRQLYKHWTLAAPLPQPCEGACLLGLGELAAALDTWLEKDGFDNTRVVLVPTGRGTPPSEEVFRLLGATHRRFVVVGGTGEQRQRLLSGVDGRPRGAGPIVLFDPLGRVRGALLPPFGRDDLVADFRAVRKRFAEECCVADGSGLRTLVIGGPQPAPAAPVVPTPE